MDYPFQSIDLNNREVFLKDILSDSVSFKDDFEKTTCFFIRDWFRGNEDFEISTSGSTGTPKRTIIKKNQMVANASATARALQLKTMDHAMVCVDTKYIAGQMMLVRCFVTGMSIHAVTPSANPLAAYNWGKNIHVVAFVPYQLSAILQSKHAAELSSITNVIVGGAPITEQLIQQLQSCKCHAFATYGMTETISHIALRQLNGPEKSDYYKVLPGITIDVDHRSCLVIKTAYLPEKIITNDMVEIINSTSFKWLGRADNVINSGGVKVSPEQIEARIELVMKAVNLHLQYIVTSLPDPTLHEKIVVVIESEPIDNQFKETLLSEMSKVLERYQIPKDILSLPLFPRTQTGKTNRLEIKKLLSKQP
jgi:o-succinylbenzoate---CoA ligase